MNPEQFHYDPISPERRKKLEEVIKRLNNQFSQEVTIEETTNDISITRHTEDGEKTYHITKIGDYIPVGEEKHLVRIENIVEAKVRYPEKTLEEALENLEE